jgi:hypothetical protein
LKNQKDGQIARPEYLPAVRGLGNGIFQDNPQASPNYRYGKIAAGEEINKLNGNKAESPSVALTRVTF